MVVKLLSKNPEDRYRSADELQEDLERVRDGLEPLAAGAAQMAPTAVLAPPAGPDAKTRAMPSTASHGRAAGGAERPALSRVAAALLTSLILLGGVAWATSEGTLARDSTAAESGSVPGVGEPTDAEDASREPSDTAARGETASIRPVSDAPGDEGPGGASNVPDAAVVPDLAGGTVADAERSLEAAGLKVGSVSETPSDAVPAGHIIEQGIPAGEPVDPATPVNLTVSSGPAPVVAQAPESGPEPIVRAAEPAPAQEAPPAQYAPAVAPAPVQEAAPPQYAAPAPPAYVEDEGGYEDESEGDDGGDEGEGED